MSDKRSKKIRIVLDGPPSHKSGRFVEVENEHGEGMSLGEWKQEGEFWYLEFPNPDQLAERNDALREAVGFFCSVIKSGEPWTDVCQERYNALLEDD